MLLSVSIVVSREAARAIVVLFVSKKRKDAAPEIPIICNSTKLHNKIMPSCAVFVSTSTSMSVVFLRTRGRHYLDQSRVSQRVLVRVATSFYFEQIEVI